MWTCARPQIADLDDSKSITCIHIWITARPQNRYICGCYDNCDLPGHHTQHQLVLVVQLSTSHFLDLSRICRFSDAESPAVFQVQVHVVDKIFFTSTYPWLTKRLHVGFTYKLLIKKRFNISACTLSHVACASGVV